MATDLLIHATGLTALVVNVIALIRTCERSLRMQSGVAGVIWALNNLLLGAHTAAALSLVSAGRTATSAATLQCGARLRLMVFTGFAVLTLAIGATTWTGWSSMLLTCASLLSTYAVFYLSGARLRCTMLLVSVLWMHHAWSHGSWEQMAANVITAAAALFGAWRMEGHAIRVDRWLSLVRRNCHSRAA
ncbi:YgjV family protein [Piscinibacter sp. XHJ-5]|uniref:YgjV family protein n=1 Tax=Piscinibacter sp. XHJ-5 TaxID=3037797 RepID=UPI002452EEC1|nr:YgjV family protein [Piscinibacter sp. XHJ-5]